MNRLNKPPFQREDEREEKISKKIRSDYKVHIAAESSWSMNSHALTRKLMSRETQNATEHSSSATHVLTLESLEGAGPKRDPVPCALPSQPQPQAPAIMINTLPENFQNCEQAGEHLGMEQTGFADRDGEDPGQTQEQVTHHRKIIETLEKNADTAGQLFRQRALCNELN